MKLIQALTLLTLAVCTGSVVCAEVTTGQAAPDFTLKDSAGKDVKLSSYQGKIVVLEWTNPECPFVQRHYGNTRTMLKLAAANPEVVWLAIDSSKHRTAADSAQWIAKDKIPYPILQDSSGEVGKTYGAKTTPHLFIVSADGKIAYQGAIDNDPRGNQKQVVNYVQQALDELKAGKPVTQADTKPYGCSVKY